MWPTVLLRLLAFSVSLTLSVPNRKIICGTNQYTVINGSLSYCLNCDTCHAGYGLHPVCGRTITHPPSNIGCKPCPNETFSSELDSGPCHGCHQCAEHEMIAAPCTRISDRICNGTCRKGYFFVKVLHTCQQCSYCCLDGKDEEQQECVKQGLNATGRHCSARLDKHCVPHLSSSTAAVTTQTHLPSLTQSPTSPKLTSSSPSHSTSPSTTAVTNKETAVTHLPATHSPGLSAKLASSKPHPTNPQVGNHSATVIASCVLSGLVLAALMFAAMCYMYKKKKQIYRRKRTESNLSGRSPGNCDNNTIQVLPQGDVAYHPDRRVQELQNTGYVPHSPSATPKASPSVTPQQTDDEVEELPNVTAERNKRLWKRQSSKESQSNVQKKDDTTENLLHPSVHVKAGNQEEDNKGVGQSMPRKQSFEALRRKLSISGIRDYQPLRQEDPDESRGDTCEAKEKITEDLPGTGVKQNTSQANTRLSTNVRDLPLSVRRQVCSLLNIKRDRDFDDYRMLAEKVGLGNDKINNVEQTESSPTHIILTEWSIKSSEATVGKLIEILKEKDFERMDVVQVLQDWVYENSVFSTL